MIVPIVYFFFPETANMRLEDIDHIFEAGGITGGVIGKNGLLRDRRLDIAREHHENVFTDQKDGSDSAEKIEYARV